MYDHVHLSRQTSRGQSGHGRDVCRLDTGGVGDGGRAAVAEVISVSKQQQTAYTRPHTTTVSSALFETS